MTSAVARQRRKRRQICLSALVACGFSAAFGAAAAALPERPSARTDVAAAGAAAVFPGASAPLTAATPAPSPASLVTDPRFSDKGLLDARAKVLARAEAQLARGDAAAAIETFDRAAMMLHAPDTEMGLVRAYMQAGEYRRALAFCAHTAGAHLESQGAGALYAWLLRLGGQRAVAERTLAEVVARAPEDAVSAAVAQAFGSQRPVATGALLDPPHRLAPQAVMRGGQAPIPEAAHVDASGVLLPGGKQALVPAASARASGVRRLWVRNGLGQATEAEIDASSQPPEALGIAVLSLKEPLEVPSTLIWTSSEPFAGSPGFLVEFAESAQSSAAWPWLQQGFLGSFAGAVGLRRLGIDMANGPHGGPVFDAQGRLAGISLPGAGGVPMMLPVSQWPLATMPHGASSAGPAEGAGAKVQAARGVIGPDEVYESALPIALQLIVER